MELAYERIDLKLSAPLTISYSSSTAASNIIVRLSAGGQTGLGEASPSAKFGETPDAVQAALELFRSSLGNDPFQFTDVMARLESRFEGNAPAKAGIDLALHDLAGKLLGVPLYKMLGVDSAKTTHLTYTIGLDSVEAMVRNSAEAAKKYKYLKVKLGCDHDADIIKSIAREVPSAIIRGDVNGGWEARHAIRMVNDVLAPNGVEFIEQPLHPKDMRGLALLYQHSVLPIVLDESIGTVDDIISHQDITDGVNIKLMKCGGICAALQMIHTARALGLKVMLGCRIETSLAITAGVHLTPLADYADLDLHLMLSRDPFVGATIDAGGKWVLPDGPGLGVVPRPKT